MRFVITRRCRSLVGCFRQQKASGSDGPLPATVATPSSVYNLPLLPIIFCRNGKFLLKARCYRSQKKTKPPYVVNATVNEVGQVVHGSCECPAGKGFCSHLQAVLNVVVLLQQKGYSEAPEHLSCTDLPQRWRRPRGEAIKGCSVQDLDWRRVGEGGQDMPLLSRLDLSKASERSVDQKRKAITQLADGLRALDGDTPLVKVLAAVNRAGVCTAKCGDVLVGSPLSYQQPLVPFGFDALLCAELEVPVQFKPGEPADGLRPFDGSNSWAIPAGLGAQGDILKVCSFWLDGMPPIEHTY